ncbi:MAG: hypothetical protein WKF57_15410 [Nakamurella sp.]
MIEPGERRPGLADDNSAPEVGDPAGRERWDRARRELTVSPPPLASILVRARTTRRRAAATVAVAAAVCATIIVVPLVTSLRADDRGPAGPQTPIRTTAVPSTRPSPAAASSVSIPPASPTSVTPIPVVVGLSFSDPQHGFAVSQQCDDPSKPAARCRYGVWRFDATAPQPWTAMTSPIPDGTTEKGWGADIVSLSAERVLIRFATGDRQHPSWFSADGGRTWSKTAQRQPVTSIPTGSRPTVECVAVSEDLGCSRPGIVVDLEDGSWTTLAAPVGVTPSAVVPGPDGRWWLVGTRGSSIVTGPTSDSGRTWSLSTVATKPSRAVFGYQLVFAGPSVVWLEVIGQHPDDDVKNGLLAIRRSADSGRTWRAVWTAAAGTEPRTQIGAAIGGAGSLQLCTELDRSYRIDAAGTATRLGAGCTAGSFRERTPWGFLEHSAGATSPGRTSTDGAHWAIVPLLPAS